MHPMMREDEIAVMWKLLGQYKPRKVLEFGAGGSTLTFSKAPYIESWTAIETSAKWTDRVRSQADLKKVRVWYSDNPSFPGCFALNVEEPDFVIVDGRNRAMCLKMVYNSIRPGIPVLLHDYRRSRYKEGVDLFEHKEVLAESLSSDKPNTIDKDVSDDGLYWHQGLMLLKKGSVGFGSFSDGWTVDDIKVTEIK